MSHNITGIRNLSTVFSQVIKNLHQARRTIKKDDFGGDQLIQQMFCISEGLGGNLFDSIDRNGKGYNITLGPESMVFLVSFLRDAISVIDNGIRDQERIAQDCEEAKKQASLIVDLQDNEDCLSPVEMICQGQSIELKDAMVDMYQHMSHEEVDDIAHAQFDGIIKNIELGSVMQSANLIRDVVLNTVEPMLSQAPDETDEKIRATAGQPSLSHHVPSSPQPNPPSHAKTSNVISFLRP